MRPLPIIVAASFAVSLQAFDAKSDDIIKRSVSAMEANWKAADKYQYKERDVEEKLTTDGKSKGKTVVTYEVTMIAGSPYERVIARSDRPLTAAEQQKEQAKMQQEIARRQKESSSQRARRIAAYRRDSAADHELMREMTNAFTFKLLGEAQIAGHTAYVLQADPKPGYRPPSQKAKVLTKMHGKLWIDKQELQWVKVEAETLAPVSFGWFIAKVGPGTRFEFMQRPVAPGLWMPEKFAMKAKASILGFNESRAEEDTFSDYRPMPQTNAALR